MVSEGERIPPGVDPSRPSVGRLYDYYLGGTDNLEVDRLAAERLREVMPELADAAWANRGFLQRAASWLASEAGIDQFVDIGAGLPTQNNTHEAAQEVRPDARVAYVDNDPMILDHARELIADVPNVVFINGDVREPDSILGNPDLRKLIDFDQPVGLLLVSILPVISDDADPWELVQRYMSHFPSGSWLALSHATADNQSPQVLARFEEVYANVDADGRFRTREEVERFFDGLEFASPYSGAEPGVSYVGLWGAEDPEAADSEGSRWNYCGVARKP